MNDETQPADSAGPAVKTCGLANVSFFLGLLSWVLFVTVICLLGFKPALPVIAGLLLALICAGFGAVVASSWAQKLIKANPALTGNSPARAGAVMGYASLIIVAAAAIVLPNFLKARITSGKNACVNNIRYLDDATKRWAVANKKNMSDIPTFADLIGTNKYGRFMPTCPANGAYILGSWAAEPVCSYLSHTLDFYSDISGRALSCRQSLAVLQVAKQQWLHTVAAVRTPVEVDLLELIKRETTDTHGKGAFKLKCEAGGAFIIGDRDEKPRCSVRSHAW